jgi:lysyl-tRNA synthetase class II
MTVTRETATQIAAFHAATTPSVWDAATDVLEAARVLFDTDQPGGVPDSAPDILAGLGRLLQHGQHPAVRLHTGLTGNVLTPLKPRSSTGPPEEDILRYALAAAVPVNGKLWPLGPADQESFARTARILIGPIRCRLTALRIVAAIYLLRLLPESPVRQRRDILRRLIWLTDPRAEDAISLLRGLTAPHDVLAPPLRSYDDFQATLTRFPLAGWSSTCTPDIRICLSGRIHAVRRHRKTVFADLAWDGQSVQLCLDPGLGSQLRNGDLVVMHGYNVLTRSRAFAVSVTQIEQLQRGTLPQRLPISQTSVVLGPLRRYLDDMGFAEFITPLMSDAFGGGTARPFTTWANAANRRQYLRVTTELNLLAAIAAGTSRCYEIGPSFRNEGLRGQPVKEFTMLEAYCVDLALDDLIEHVATLIGSLESAPPSPQRMSFDEAFTQITGVNPSDAPAVRAMAAAHIPAYYARTEEVDLLTRRLWRNLVRQQLRGLVAITAIPGPSSPLVAGMGRQAERVWLYLDGVEIAEASRNELHPRILSERFERQFADDPHPVHRAYQDVLSIIEDGLPPVVGVGLGVTRLAQVLYRRRSASLGNED